MENVNTYTVVIKTENSTGLLSQFSNIFTRRSLDIWSLYAAPSDVPGEHTLAIVTDNATERKVIEVVKHLEKRVEVLNASYYEGDLVSDKIKVGFQNLK